ncbi:extracellular matrix protein 1 isoform X2 [Conger conger]|uniref:extracellular matrix protein 1 isoform X2 n=1 Tax=Conger conger TaxID=82655 RepID=UPI002A599EDC|nr:extracellular matrix protein 1 isoform X2 [Conger conger]
MGFLGHLRGLWALIILLFCVPSHGQSPPLRGTTYVLFPPGQPVSTNLEAICKRGFLRPRYDHNDLPSPGYSYLRRQATGVNSLESLFQGCCKSYGSQEDALTLKCALGVWESAMSSYCEQEFMVKTRAYHCCTKEEMFGCFALWAPNPAYLYPPPKIQE